MSQDGKRNTDSIASKLIAAGFPADLDGLRFNAALNIWEFAAFGGTGTPHMLIICHLDDDPNSDTEFASTQGSQFLNPNELQRQTVVTRATTFSLLYIEVNANARVGNTDFTFRVNGISVNQDINIAAGLTGFFQDVVNTDAVVAEDLISKRQFGVAGSNFDITATGNQYT